MVALVEAAVTVVVEVALEVVGGVNTIMGSCIATWEDSKGGVTGAKWGRGRRVRKIWLREG